MDDLTYHYGTRNNRLQYVEDAVADSPWLSDVENQVADSIVGVVAGSLVSDESEGIDNIDWTVYGKVSSVTHSSGDVVNYRYDAAGNRIHKRMEKADGSIKETFYVRDASGNIMGVFDGDGTVTSLHEIPIYGSDRLGQYRPAIQLVTLVDGEEI